MKTLNSEGPELEILSGAGVSELLDIPEGTLANWRYQGSGPRYYRVGKHVRFRRSDVMTWLEQQARDPHRRAGTP